MSAKKTRLASAEAVLDCSLSEEFDLLVSLIEKTYQAQQRLLRLLADTLERQNKAARKRRAKNPPWTWEDEKRRVIEACRAKPATRKQLAETERGGK